MNNIHELAQNNHRPGINEKAPATIFTVIETDRIIEMAWEDRTSFEAIEVQFGLKEKDVIELMRKEMKASSFRMWRKRHHGRSTKHAALRGNSVNRFKCKSQRAITLNKISKR
ncbi:TIGR03643 family protein [Ferruginibacter paludis]|uniref:TIGR03643 family protein n=1 Tax=Ferruginibacter paludis TaxID=1310417 RepID=UPI0025B4FF29|nr:TIGR03643 family protein [Ferruginibacter paludis]MDN3658057.1 TIGR03643 family protein [Ferruginibacter paludis]